MLFQAVPEAWTRDPELQPPLIRSGKVEFAKLNEEMEA